jgi:hypothetical protein
VEKWFFQNRLQTCTFYFLLLSDTSAYHSKPVSRDLRLESHFCAQVFSAPRFSYLLCPRFLRGFIQVFKKKLRLLVTKREGRISTLCARVFFLYKKSVLTQEHKAMLSKNHQTEVHWSQGALDSN